MLADVIARELGADLDVLLVRKLRAPGRPELAIGAVTEQGLVLVNEGWDSLPESYLRSEAEAAHEVLRNRRAAYTPQRAPVPPAGRTAIVVDDGIATGSTMSAAIRSLRDSGARRIVVAAAVAAPETVRELRSEADEVLYLAAPENFFAVSQFYEEFPEVPEEDVVDLLGRWSAPSRGGLEGSPPLLHGDFGGKPDRRRK